MLNINNIEERLNIEDEIKEIGVKIKKLKKEKKDYLLENSGVIFEYFEKKKEVSLGKSNKVPLILSIWLTIIMLTSSTFVFVFDKNE